MTEVSEQKRLGDRIVALTAERDDYILKQKVWEAANDELRSEHIRMTARIRELGTLLDECYETGRAPTSDELDRLKIPTALETPAEPSGMEMAQREADEAAGDADPRDQVWGTK